MTTAVRWAVVAVLAIHGLIHVLGAVKGFGWSAVSQLEEPISPRGGLIWMLAAVLVLTCAGFLAAGAPTWWWALALGAAVVSEIAIGTSWSDAKVGTVVNLVLVLAAGYGFAGEGPSSFHAQYRERATSAVAEADPSPPTVSDADLVDLPLSLADYIRRSGAVGRPRVVSFRADFHGRIRSGPDAGWMPFTGQQVNTYGPRPQRIFLMDATRSGIPVTVLHVFCDSSATMNVKLLSLFTVLDASGPEMDRGETVTVFNDLVVMAPGAIIDAHVTWEVVDDLHVRGAFTDGGETVSATLTFNAEHDLIDFVSDDRTRASADGKTFTARRWSTPLAGYHEIDGHRVMAGGEGVWHAEGSKRAFTYLELNLDSIAYNVGDADMGARTIHVHPAAPEGLPLTEGVTHP